MSRENLRGREVLKSTVALRGTKVLRGRALGGVKGGAGYRWNLNPAPGKAQTPDMHCKVQSADQCNALQHWHTHSADQCNAMQRWQGNTNTQKYSKAQTPDIGNLTRQWYIGGVKRCCSMHCNGVAAKLKSLIGPTIAKQLYSVQVMVRRMMIIWAMPKCLNAQMPKCPNVQMPEYLFFRVIHSSHYFCISLAPLIYYAGSVIVHYSVNSSWQSKRKVKHKTLVGNKTRMK